MISLPVTVSMLLCMQICVFCCYVSADVYVTCISFIRNTGLLAVGFNFGCFQLWKLSIPVLEYVLRLISCLVVFPCDIRSI